MNPALSQHLSMLGLERSPFPPTPDAASYYSTAKLQSELVEAAHALRMRAGFVLLTGEVGTGKSTFLRRLLGQLEGEGMAVSLVFNTFLQGDDLLAAVLRDFGLSPMGNPAADIECLNRFLIDRWKQRTGCVVIIDDAQNLSTESLELVRLLTNLETDQEKLLQIVLSGQPELRENLALPQMRQLTSRICKHVQLSPLTLADTGHYVQFRLSRAGAEQTISVPADAVKALYHASNGNPRRIHLIMDRSLYVLYGQAGQQRRISASIVKQAALEAGALPIEAPPRLRVGLAASTAIAASLALATGLYWGSSTTGSASGTSASAVQTKADVVPPTETLSGTCDAEMYDLKQLIPAQTAVYFKKADGVCTDHSANGWTLHWNGTPTIPADATQSDPTLYMLQQSLISLGQYDGPLDGRYGHLTQRAFARVQQQYGLAVTGIADLPTQQLLNALRNATITSTPDTNHHGNG